MTDKINIYINWAIAWSPSAHAMQMAIMHFIIIIQHHILCMKASHPSNLQKYSNTPYVPWSLIYKHIHGICDWL